MISSFDFLSLSMIKKSPKFKKYRRFINEVFKKKPDKSGITPLFEVINQIYIFSFASY